MSRCKNTRIFQPVDLIKNSRSIIYEKTVLSERDAELRRKYSRVLNEYSIFRNNRYGAQLLKSAFKNPYQREKYTIFEKNTRFLIGHRIDYCGK